MKTDNELIAEFMGEELEVINDVTYMALILNENDEKIEAHNYLQYDVSWDWLMPVVEKIRMISIGDNPENKLLSYEVLIASHAKSFRCSISKHWWQHSVPQEEFICGRRDTTSLIDVTYKSVVTFIKWYNTQPK